MRYCTDCSSALLLRTSQSHSTTRVVVTYKRKNDTSGRTFQLCSQWVEIRALVLPRKESDGCSVALDLKHKGWVRAAHPLSARGPNRYFAARSSPSLPPCHIWKGQHLFMCLHRLRQSPFGMCIIADKIHKTQAQPRQSGWAAWLETLSKPRLTKAHINRGQRATPWSDSAHFNKSMLPIPYLITSD